MFWASLTPPCLQFGIFLSLAIEEPWVLLTPFTQCLLPLSFCNPMPKSQTGYPENQELVHKKSTDSISVSQPMNSKST